MGILRILGVVTIGILTCVAIIVISCLCVSRQAEQIEELDHPERIEMR